MGYCVSLTGQKFFLHSSKIDACIANILNNEKLVKQVVEAKKRIKYFDNIPAIFQLVELVKAMWSFQLTPNKHGDVDKISYEGEKMRDFENFLHLVAPLVESGSYLEFRGEDSEMWRYLFKDNGWAEIRPKVIWPD
jgi:hypothetical protein